MTSPEEYALTDKQRRITAAIRDAIERTCRELDMPACSTTYRVVVAACNNAATPYQTAAELDVELALGEPREMPADLRRAVGWLIGRASR